jgi:FtsP/CotA-like multicopper oxidase with cupredoxin domain
MHGGFGLAVGEATAVRPSGSRSMNQPKSMGIRLTTGDIGCEGPGYVWHCHIIDPEDNEMMRPYKLTK